MSAREACWKCLSSNELERGQMWQTCTLEELFKKYVYPPVVQFRGVDDGAQGPRSRNPPPCGKLKCDSRLAIFDKQANSQGPGVGRRESGDGSRESGDGSRESGVGSRGSGVGSQGPRARGQGSGVGGRETVTAPLMNSKSPSASFSWTCSKPSGVVVFSESRLAGNFPYSSNVASPEPYDASLDTAVVCGP